MHPHTLSIYDFTSIPIIDISPFLTPTPIPPQQQTASLIRQTCKASGFFYISNHGVPPTLRHEVIKQAIDFFSLPLDEKMQIHMKKGGRAWRGYFPAGEELTSGKIDMKEGVYFGEELGEGHELVEKGVYLHGRNLFPVRPEGLRKVVLEWMAEMFRLGGVIMEAIAMSLQLPKDYFRKDICKEPLGLFRIFNYPKDDKPNDLWGVGEHTDYGLITILMNTDKGLQVKNRSNEWVKADPIQNTFIINIGDMLQRLTRGLYRSTPHRVKNKTSDCRLAFPFFYDPGWTKSIHELDIKTTPEQQVLLEQAQNYQRWDKMQLKEVSGTYGDYLTRKVSKVFPDLAKEKLSGVSLY